MGKADGSSNPTIKLIMLNGPLSGQIFDFKPESKVQIGRVVRGNAVTIKDAGVSSKHLLIEFQLLQGHWVVSDLDSSNGTFLNERLLDPFSPAQISHGDVIKIGESTSISVEIGVNEEECMMTRGNPPRRRGRNVTGKDKKDVSELEEKREDLDGTVNTLGKVEAKVEEKAGPVSVSSVIHEKISGVRVNPGDSGVEVVVEKEEIKEGSKRVTRGMRKKANLMGELKEKQEVVSQMTTRSKKVLDSLEENVGQAIRKTRKGRKGKQNVEAEEPLVENVQLEKEVVVLASSSDTKLHETKDARPDNKPVVNEAAVEMSQRGASVDPLTLEKSVNSGVEGCMNSTSSSGSKKLDLENMTLGDLFDHWEVSLPKQIIDATEVMISDMREKSKRLHEFRLQKMKEKDSAANNSILTAAKTTTKCPF